MFQLTLMRDIVQVAPSSFHYSVNECVVAELNKHYSNKVIQDVGLALFVYDVLEVGDCFLKHGEGGYRTNVKFRIVVFKPFINEILEGRVKYCTPEGVRVTMDFFDDIVIPANCLQPGSEFDTSENLWVWKYDGNDLYMDIDEPIRFTVLAEEFTDISLLSPENRKKEDSDTAVPEVQQPPYVIKGSIQEDGLGLVSWWG